MLILGAQKQLFSYTLRENQTPEVGKFQRIFQA